jgi:hypothetical protein
MSYENPDAIVFCCQLQTIHDGVIRFYVRYSIALDALHGQLALLFGEDPHSSTCVRMREVRQK